MNQPSQTKPTTSGKILPPFGIENVHPNNSDLMLQGVEGGLRLRGPVLKPVISQTAGQCPAVPGAQLHLNPKTGEYTMRDPLNDEQHIELRSRLQRWLTNSRGVRVTGEIRGAKTITGKLDRNRVKTLCKELAELEAEGHIKAIKGAVPTIEEVDEMPGRYLLNPGARFHNLQPRFVDEYEEYKEHLTTSAG